MNLLWKSLRFIFFLFLLPLLISRLVIFVVSWLVAIQFIYNDKDGVMMSVAGILVDLVLQSAYFAVLILVTRQYRLTVILLGYQFFMAFMFLYGGLPTLFGSVFFLIGSSYLKLTAPI
jgi:hypothetical protein